MEDPIIDDELSKTLPEMSKVEFEQLEKNIVNDGEIYDPIIVWSETNAIVDGHHRWKIHQKYPDLPYEIKYMGFPGKWAAKAWMCANAVGQRNLTEAQEAMVMANELEAKEMTCGGDRGTEHDESGRFTARSHDETLRSNKNDTASEIATEHNVSRATVYRAAETKKGVDAAEKISPGFEQKVMSGDIDVPKSTLASITKVSEEKRPEIVEMIQGAKEKKDVQKIQDEIQKDIRAQRGTDMAAFRRSLREAINGADLLIAKALTGDEMEEQEGCEIAMEELGRGIEIMQKHIRFVEGYEK